MSSRALTIWSSMEHSQAGGARDETSPRDWGEGAGVGRGSVTRQAGGMLGRRDELSLNKSLTHGRRIP